MIDDIFEH